MKKSIFILPILMILFQIGFASNNQKGISNDHSSTYQPGDTLFVEIPTADADKLSNIKSSLDKENIEWLGHCASTSVICIKLPASADESLGYTLKQILQGPYKIHTTTSESYSLTDPCFVK